MQVRVAMLFLAAGAAAAQTAAPTPQGNAGVIRVNVPDVMVPVIVTDRKRHHAALSVIRHRPNSNRGGTLLSDMDRGAATVAFQNGSAMEQAARATGGIYFHDSNDMLKQLRSVLADGREYYLLAYMCRRILPRTDRSTVSLWKWRTKSCVCAPRRVTGQERPRIRPDAVPLRTEMIDRRFGLPCGQRSV